MILRITILAALAGIMSAAGLSSCSWVPERDNPRDPESQFYQEPPPPNLAPVIDTVYMFTECRNHLLGLFCSFSILSVVYDENDNLDFDHVNVEIQLRDSTWLSLGNMDYDADVQSFSLSKTQDDFSNQSLEQLVGRPVHVTARDHNGLSDEATLIFQEPLTRLPLMGHPLDNDVVPVRQPILGWAYWGDTTAAQTFDVSVYLQGYFLAWDTVGLLASDTSVVVGAELLTSNTEPHIFYTWTLTAVERGNRITAKPQNFSVVIPDTLRDQIWIR
jgi:hypothetical protein